MDILLNNLAGDRLYFATGFLDMVNKTARALNVEAHLVHGEMLGTLPSFYDRIKLQSVPPADEKHYGVVIHTVKQWPHNDILSSEQCDHLVFPILDEDATRAFNKKAFDSEPKAACTLIMTENTPRSGFFCGDLMAAEDMLHRSLIKPDIREIAILISAGPTAEDLDPVRYITNRSSGKMGIAIARAAYRRGANVTLVCGPTALAKPMHMPVIHVRSAEEMAAQIITHFERCRLYIAAAAVADYKPEKREIQKIKKSDQDLLLHLKKTKDILMEVNQLKSGQKVVGFSLETENVVENARQKLKKKSLDMIVANNPMQSGAGFATETNLVTIIDKEGAAEQLPMLSKIEVAHQILDRIRRSLISEEA